MPGTRWCPVIGEYAELLLGRSLLAKGSEPHDPVCFTQLVAGLMETGLDAAPAAPEEVLPETPSEVPDTEHGEAGSSVPVAGASALPVPSAAQPGEASDALTEKASGTESTEEATADSPPEYALDESVASSDSEAAVAPAAAQQRFRPRRADRPPHEVRSML